MPFSFLNTALLAGLAAAALPILIHLFSRRKVAKVPFSSLQFLEEIAKKRVRRMKLTQWIILALRVLALALLALALGRPAFQGDFALGKSRGESAVAMILDRSFSMGAEGTQATLWESALERADQVFSAMESNDQVTLISVDPADDTLEPYPGPDAARDAVRLWDPGFGATDYAASVRRAASVLAQATALNKELFLISDFQASGLKGAVEEGGGHLGAELPENVRIYLVPVHDETIANAAIETARLEGSAVDQRVFVQVAQHADVAADDITVTVEAGAEVLGEAVISVGARDVQTVRVALTRLPGEGEELRARITRDRLATDDVRYVPALGTGQIKTLLVQDPAAPSPFLALALDPAGQGGRFQVTRIPPAALGSSDLSETRLVVLDNITLLSREAIMRLRGWRQAGGAVFISLGERTDLRYTNEQILPALFEGVTLDNLLGADEATSVSYSLTPRAAGHEAFQGFNAEVGSPLTGASFWRVVAVRNGPGVRTLAEFGPGLPALVQGDRALLFASSLDGKWNNLPAHAAFVPLLHQSLDAILREGAEDNLLVGDAVTGVADQAAVPSGVDILGYGPDGAVLDVALQVVPRGISMRTEPARAPGFYTVRAGARGLVRRAVNVDPGESDLTPTEPATLAALFPNHKVEILPAGSALGTPIREARYGREFWRELVLLVLLIMAVEGWLSRRGVT